VSQKLPEGYRIVWGETLSGTGYGDEQYGFILQKYGTISYRRWFKTYTYLGWVTIDKNRWTEGKEQLIQTAHLHAKANKND
jgi:hypothetical protein